MRFEYALPASLLLLAASATSATADESDGLRIELLSGPVSCSRPTRNGDSISVNYKGTLETTGEEFDESYSRGKPFIFTLGKGKVIKGWDEGLVGMCIGQSRVLTIPPSMAYGDHPVGKIPAGSTLVFVTHLEDIVSLTKEDWELAHASQEVSTPSATPSPTQEEQSFAIATAPAHPEGDSKSADTPVEQETTNKESSSPDEPEKARCQLLGPFALLVQGALGALALLTLIWKRWRETPKRPWKIFVFDVSKQVLGSMLTHVINLAISMLSSVDMANAAAHIVQSAGEAAQDSDGRTPNPCSFYLLNLAIDTTLGVPILWLWLKVLHGLALHTPLARPPASIKSGNYGSPPSAKWYGKQLLIYCIGLVLMKFCVLLFFSALPWLPWVGDWALRWTDGNEALEITFALFIFPLAMNAIQYWVIDNFIMDKSGSNEKGAGESTQEYQAVAADDEEEQRRMIMEGDDEFDEDAVHSSGVEASGDGERERLTAVDDSAKRK